ncbi:DUF2783 domain-containing protein [Rubrivivax sp. RP6-9]|uniref:DUF2783 domain-containing protein n=1 Tax=Rubrivivax sp. RP6-9 TaxID=3415750 RepID=UPI003CC680DF
MPDDTLTTAATLERPDDFYAALLAAHDGLSDAQSQALNARLVLLLANAVGHHATLLRLLHDARRSL